MNRRIYRFTQPPTALHRAKLDNLALVPANLLPYKAQWKKLANDLPQGAILIILPDTDQRLRKAVETVADLLEADGHRVKTISANQFN